MEALVFDPWNSLQQKIFKEYTKLIEMSHVWLCLLPAKEWINAKKDSPMTSKGHGGMTGLLNACNFFSKPAPSHDVHLPLLRHCFTFAAPKKRTANY